MICSAITSGILRKLSETFERHISWVTFLKTTLTANLNFPSFNPGWFLIPGAIFSSIKSSKKASGGELWLSSPIQQRHGRPWNLGPGGLWGRDIPISRIQRGVLSTRTGWVHRTTKKHPRQVGFCINLPGNAHLCCYNLKISQILLFLC